LGKHRKQTVLLSCGIERRSVFFVLVATAQATVMWTPPQLQAYINKVVNHPKFGGRGLGMIFMDALEDVAQPE
jgi:hypothetical protein